MILTPGMGAVRTVRTARRLGGAARLLSASLTELEGAGMPANAAQFCFDGRALRAAEEELSRVRECGGQLLCLDDPAYPQMLGNIYDPPPVLWLRGDPALLSLPGIGVVGTRHPSPYGAGMAEVLSRDLAARGLIIHSGMARGVDTAAHKGALSAPNGRTLAVWGTSIDVIYPRKTNGWRRRSYRAAARS